jgi:hypothetical protein
MVYILAALLQRLQQYEQARSLAKTPLPASALGVDHQ